MRHYTRKEWDSYILNQISAEDREYLEEHLYTCDSCLTLYLECMDEQSANLPFTDSEANLTSPALQMIRSSEHKKHGFYKTLYRKTVFHYTIAAAITLLLMSTGVFQDLFTGSAHLTSAASSQQETFTDKLMQGAVKVLDSISEQHQR